MCHKEYSVLSDLTNLAQNVNWLHFISLSNVAEAQYLNDQSFKQYYHSYFIHFQFRLLKSHSYGSNF